MIKSELVQRIRAQNPHLYHHRVENLVNAILDEIASAIARGDRVELRDFGAFSCPFRKSYPCVSMMKTRQNGYGDNGSVSLDRPMLRSILL